MHAPRGGRPLRVLLAVQVALIVGATMLIAGPVAGGSRGSAGTGSDRGAAAAAPVGPPAPSGGPAAQSGVAPRPTLPPPPGPVVTRPPAPVPAASPRVAPPLPAGGGPPSCAYLDELTEHRAYSDWDRTLLDTVYRLPSGYAPRDLVDSSAAGLNAGYPVRRIVVDDLRAMAAAARDAGAPIQVVSAYRSHATQGTTFRRWVRAGGYQQALRTSARPGHSEHQLGTAVDVTSRGGRDPWTYRDWATTKAGAWIAANSWRYGFVVSYPRGSFARTCYSYEPWHLRYVGRERAAAIRTSGLTPREFLWRIR